MMNVRACDLVCFSLSVLSVSCKMAISRIMKGVNRQILTISYPATEFGYSVFAEWQCGKQAAALERCIPRALSELEPSFSPISAEKNCAVPLLRV